MTVVHTLLMHAQQPTRRSSQDCITAALLQYKHLLNMANLPRFCALCAEPSHHACKAAVLMQVAKDFEDMDAELNKHTQLANMFDCPDTVTNATEGVATIKADLVMVKDVWDCSSLVEQQFQVLIGPADTV